ncbi:hypothetical protein AB1Y20_002012 [Prymnesium parvum]|uniref:Uncharacterized protein n=1 Tax=Prymnesium parvum TaxID=97485 RepID=A0AB34J7W2_PRYPA
MGSAIARAAAAGTPARAAAASAPKGSFPPPPLAAASAPPLDPPPSPQGEIEHGRSVAKLFGEATIRSVDVRSAGAAAAPAPSATTRLDADDLVRALTLHAQDPARNTPAALVAQFGLADRESISCFHAALEYCRPYYLVQGIDGLLEGKAVHPATTMRTKEAPAKEAA